MQSMTGYGRCQLERDGRVMTVEVKSVNHRFLDTSYRLPRHLAFLDDAVRRGVSARLSRGHVDVFVNYENHRDDAREVRVDTALACAYQRAIGELSAALSLSGGLSVEEYARMPDVLTIQEKEEDQQAVRELFDEALSAALCELIAMREREGESMKQDMLQKLTRIEEIRGEIAQRAPLVVEDYRALPEGGYMVSGSANLDDMLELFDIDKEYDPVTVNGWVQEQLGRFPKAGDRFDCDGLLVTVEKADKRRATEVRVEKIAPQESEEEE